MGRNWARIPGIALIAGTLSVSPSFGEGSGSSSLRGLIAGQSPAQLEPPKPVDIAGPAGRSIFGERSRRVPDVVDGRFQLPPLMAATTETKDIGNGQLPGGFREDEPTPMVPIAESAAQRGADIGWIGRHWAAPNTFANPRYFEDRMLERHGHERWGHLQPLAAGARFFATIPALPYLMTVKPLFDTEYSLGHYRAGSRAPALMQRPPYERRAAVAEGAAIAGGILVFP